MKFEEIMVTEMSEAFESIKAGLLEAKAFSEGKSNRANVRHIEVQIPDVAKIRSKSGMSQINFARSIGVAVGTLQGWEQGRRIPQGPSRILLALIDKQPTLIQDTLAH